jgi:hypothetical protein
LSSFGGHSVLLNLCPVAAVPVMPWCFAGWQFDGFLAAGDNKALGLRGNDWECPILSRLPRIKTPPALASLPALGGNCNSAAAVANQPLHMDVAASAAAAAAAILEPSVSQQLLLLQPKHKRGIAGSSSMSSFALTGSLLGVGHYPGAGFAVGCDSETISSSVSDCSPVSEVSSSSGSASAQQGSSRYIVSGAVLSSSDAATTSESALDSAAAAIHGAVGSSSSSSSSTAVSGAGPDMLCSTGPAAVMVTDGAVVPLTEPVLAAAAAATEAAGSDCFLAQQQPPSNLYAWLEQTPEPSQAVAVAAAAAAAACTAELAGWENGSSSSCSGGGRAADAVVMIEDFSIGKSPGKADSSALQQLADHPAVLVDSAPADTLQGTSPSAAKAAADSVTSLSPTSPSSSSSSSSGRSRDWFFCISPEACNFPITWWLGSYDGQFDVAGADGPHRLDLGTTLYAATLWQDPKVCCMRFRGCSLCIVVAFLSAMGRPRRSV